jgi:thiamine-phosphate pyrophosphorylase
MARWWSELMTLPAVLSDPAAVGEAASPEGCDFIALGDSLWATHDVAAALKAIVDGLKVAA